MLYKLVQTRKKPRIVNNFYGAFKMRKRGMIFMSSSTTFFLYTYVFCIYICIQESVSKLFTDWHFFYLGRFSDGVYSILRPHFGVFKLSANTPCRSLTTSLHCVHYFHFDFSQEYAVIFVTVPFVSRLEYFTLRVTYSVAVCLV